MVAGEHIQLAIVTPTATLPLVRSGRLKALAVTSLKRLSTAQEIPTVNESGIPGFEATAWYGYVVPKLTPDAIAKVLETELERAVNSIKAREFAKRSEEHTSELQSLMRTSYAVFCLKKKFKTHNYRINRLEVSKPIR